MIAGRKRNNGQSTRYRYLWGHRVQAGGVGSQVVDVLADSANDNHLYGKRIEANKQRPRTGNRFVCPENPPVTKEGSKRAKQESASTSIRQQPERRRQGPAVLQSRRGQKPYARGAHSVESFTDWLQSFFASEHRACHRGLDNTRSRLPAATFAYQILLPHNHRSGK